MKLAYNLSTSKNSSIDKIIKRCHVLQNILDTTEYHTRSSIISMMQKRGFAKYTPGMYMRDKTILNRNSTFIKDLLQSNFSAYIENVYRRAEWIEEELVTLYNTNWNNDKIITSETINKEGSIVELITKHKTSLLAAPKLQALSLMTKIQELKHAVVTGDNLQLSAALLGQKFILMQKELDTLRKTAFRSKSAKEIPAIANT